MLVCVCLVSKRNRERVCMCVNDGGLFASHFKVVNSFRFKLIDILYKYNNFRYFLSFEVTRAAIGVGLCKKERFSILLFSVGNISTFLITTKNESILYFNSNLYLRWIFCIPGIQLFVL